VLDKTGEEESGQQMLLGSKKLYTEKCNSADTREMHWHYALIYHGQALELTQGSLELSVDFWPLPWTLQNCN